MGATLDVYRRYRVLGAGAYDRLTEVVDEQWVETCVGLTGWTIGLEIAAANFAGGIARGFSDLKPKEIEIVERGDVLVIRGSNTAVHSGPFLGIQATGKSISWEFIDMYRVGADGRLNWHFFVTDWKYVRLQLLGQAPDLPSTPARRAVLAEASQ